LGLNGPSYWMGRWVLSFPYRSTAVSSTGQGLDHRSVVAKGTLALLSHNVYLITNTDNQQFTTVSLLDQKFTCFQNFKKLNQNGNFSKLKFGISNVIFAEGLTLNYRKGPEFFHRFSKRCYPVLQESSIILPQRSWNLISGLLTVLFDFFFVLYIRLEWLFFQWKITVWSFEKIWLKPVNNKLTIVTKKSRYIRDCFTRTEKFQNIQQCWKSLKSSFYGHGASWVYTIYCSNIIS